MPKQLPELEGLTLSPVVTLTTDENGLTAVLQNGRVFRGAAGTEWDERQPVPGTVAAHVRDRDRMPEPPPKAPDEIRVDLVCGCGNRDDLDIIAPFCSGDCGSKMRLERISPARVRTMATIIVNSVAELPDRTSPEDQPEMMLVTSKELLAIILEVLEQNA